MNVSYAQNASVFRSKIHIAVYEISAPQQKDQLLWPPDQSPSRGEPHTYTQTQRPSHNNCPIATLDIPITIIFLYCCLYGTFTPTSIYDIEGDLFHTVWGYLVQRCVGECFNPKAHFFNPRLHSILEKDNFRFPSHLKYFFTFHSSQCLTLVIRSHYWKFKLIHILQNSFTYLKYNRGDFSGNSLFSYFSTKSRSTVVWWTPFGLHIATTAIYGAERSLISISTEAY